MSYDNYKFQQPDDSYYAEPEPCRCDNCLVEEETFELGIEVYAFPKTARLCSYCLDDFHNHYSLIN